MNKTSTTLLEGLLLVDKPQGRTSFSLIKQLRKITGIQKIGHAGTLDPFATGVMVILLGRTYTRLSDQLLLKDKEYLAEVNLGVSTDTFDCDGKVVGSSKKKISIQQVEQVLAYFQGDIDQVPPMYSAKKINGKKLYTLARAGVEVERPRAKVHVATTLLSYNYPLLSLRLACSKGTYIRSIAHEIGQKLKCGAHLSQLRRIRSGCFTIEDCFDGNMLYEDNVDVIQYLRSYEDYLST